MKKSEQAAVVRIIRHMQTMQQQISKPTAAPPTDEEVLKIIELFWEWTPTANQPLPSKHTMENLVGLMRGCRSREYCYISSSSLAQIICKAAEEKLKNGLASESPLSIYLKKGYQDMSDVELYRDGRWNYRETPLVKLLFDLHCNPHLYGSDGAKKR